MPGLRGRPRSPVFAWEPLRRGLPCVGRGRRAGGRGPASPPSPKMPFRFAARPAPTTTRGPARLLLAAAAATGPARWHTPCKSRARRPPRLGPLPPLAAPAARGGAPVTSQRESRCGPGPWSRTRSPHRVVPAASVPRRRARAHGPAASRHASCNATSKGCANGPGTAGGSARRVAASCGPSNARLVLAGNGGRRWPPVDSATRSVRGRRWPLPYATLPPCRYPLPSPPPKTP